MPRASLPGADALFGPRPEPEPSETRAGARVAADRQIIHLCKELFAAEPEAVAQSKQVGHESGVSAEVGALLRWLVGRFAPMSLVEVGSAGGTTGLWMLEAMARQAVLTSIEADEQSHKVANEVFVKAEAGRRIRAINADTRTILPRLSDAGYGMMLLHRPDPTDLADVRRLLQPGGFVVTLSVADPRYGKDAERFLHQLADDGQFDTAFLPIDSGVAVSTFQS